MTMRGPLSLSYSHASNNNPSRAPLDYVLGMAVPPQRAGALPTNCNSGAAPIATIRHTLRAIASETGPGEGLNRVKLLRPLVAHAHEILRERVESGASAQDYLLGRARIADSVLVGLLHIASISSGIRDGSMVAPFAAIAVGGYGRRELAPGSDLDVLFLLPKRDPYHVEGVPPATRARVGAVVACLWDLGLL